MSTETETPNLTARVESEKALVETSEKTAESTSMTSKIMSSWKQIIAAILLVLGVGLLARYLWNSYVATETVEATQPISDNADATAGAVTDAANAVANGAANVAAGAAATASDAAKGASNAVAGIVTANGTNGNSNGSSSEESEEQEEEDEVTAEDLAGKTVPWFQREFAKLEAVEACEKGKYGDQPFPYDEANDIYKGQAFNRLATTGHCEKKHDLYTLAHMAPGDTASEIYARAQPHGIGLLNRGAIRDPEKMLPRAKPGDEKHRKFQVGASIADIQKHLPKTADLMQMARRRPSGLSFQIPSERPPLYTEGINCERRARAPTRSNDKNQLFCINPIDPREYYDYRPHPLLDSVLTDGGRYPSAALASQGTGVSVASAAGSSAAAAAGTQ